MSEQEPWPTDIRVNKDRNRLAIKFDNSDEFDLSAEYLRVFSPSAEVQGHSESQRVTVSGRRDVLISELEQVGNYAVKIKFDDGHDTGLYSWGYLHTLGTEFETKWAGYVAELAEKNLTRAR